jgi:hypothetical protein
MGDQSLPLPDSISLGADGRSIRPLSIDLKYDPVGNQAVLSLDGAIYSVTATPRAPELQVAISAGDTTGWSIDALDITVSDSATTKPKLPDGVATDADASQKSGTDSDKPGAPERAGAHKRALKQAIQMAALGDLDGAERTMVASGRSTASAARREMDLASHLVQVANALRDSGDLKNSASIAQLVLQHAGQCVKLATTTDNNLAGSALELGGFVQERFFGDIKAAELAYRKALVLSSVQLSAQSALDRIAEASSSEQRKLKAWGRD